MFQQTAFLIACIWPDSVETSWWNGLPSVPDHKSAWSFGSLFGNKARFYFNQSHGSWIPLWKSRQSTSFTWAFIWFNSFFIHAASDIVLTNTSYDAFWSHWSRDSWIPQMAETFKAFEMRVCSYQQLLTRGGGWEGVIYRLRELMATTMGSSCLNQHPVTLYAVAVQSADSRTSFL